MHVPAAGTGVSCAVRERATVGHADRVSYQHQIVHCPYYSRAAAASPPTLHEPTPLPPPSCPADLADRVPMPWLARAAGLGLAPAGPGSGAAGGAGLEEGGASSCGRAGEASGLVVLGGAGLEEGAA